MRNLLRSFDIFCLTAVDSTDRERICTVDLTELTEETNIVQPTPATSRKLHRPLGQLTKFLNVVILVL